VLGNDAMKLGRFASVIAFFAGLGITLHAVASELYHKAGYAEILRPQGEYIGLALMVASFITLLRSR